jgi:23S rRNA pseudouridine2605 synthase
MTETTKPSRPSRRKPAAAGGSAKFTDTVAETKARLLALFEEARPEERIAKRMARAGLCSRRDAERWIEAGRVSVDGAVLTSPALTVTDKSRILIDGNPLPVIEPPRLWRFHKPRGVLTTDRDPEGRPTLLDKLPKDLPRVVAVGRLDFDSEGLLLLTNDGELSRYLELPTTGWMRRYRVRVYGELKDAELKALQRGVTVDGVRYGPIEVTVDKAARTNSWLTVGIREGKNREIRKVMEHIGLTVSRLLRVSYGPFQLGDLEPGEAAEIKRAALKDQLGLGGGEDMTGRAKAKPKMAMRPGSRAAGKPSTNFGGKPSGKSSGKPSGKPEGKPDGKPGGKPVGKPGGKSDGKKPGGKPGAASDRATLTLKKESSHADRRRKPTRG